MVIAEGGYAELRRRAEETLRITRSDVASLAQPEVQRLIYDLQVHQIELEMQNEQLLATSRELEETRSAYQELYELAPVGYLDLDSVGAIRRVNLAGATLLGSDREAVVGRRLAHFIAPGDARLLASHLDDAALAGHARCELRISTKSSAARFLLLQTSCADASYGYRTTLSDVTERRQAELRLEELNQQLEARVAERTAELEARNHQLELETAARARSQEEQQRLETQLREAERLRSIGLLAGGIAHDFNNLLVGIVGTADLLLYRRELCDDAREGLGIIKLAGREAAELTRQLLVYAGQGRIRLEPLNLNDCVAASLKLVRGTCPTEIELRAELCTAASIVLGDRSQVQQVVSNLFMNAIEAIGDANGTVTVRTRRVKLESDGLARYPYASELNPGDYVVLEVTDTGRGISAEALPRIFEPFFTTKFTGRGLGLASVLGSMRAHNAAARVETEVGRGTSFEIAWPAVATSVEASGDSQRASGVWRNSGRALVVDDDRMVRSSVARQLTFLGFDVVQAENGDQALRLVDEAATPFAILLLDRVMPGMTGDQVLAEVHRTRPDTPVIIMSGYSADDLQLTSDRVVFMQKPMSLAEMQEAVDQVLGGAGRAACELE